MGTLKKSRPIRSPTTYWCTREPYALMVAKKTSWQSLFIDSPRYTMSSQNYSARNKGDLCMTAEPDVNLDILTYTLIHQSLMGTKSMNNNTWYKYLLLVYIVPRSVRKINYIASPKLNIWNIRYSRWCCHILLCSVLNNNY